MSEHKQVNILMVDDSPAKLLSYEVILKELGENLIKATSGREALERLLKNDVAVVLMDVSMPELDGFELAEMIRQHPRFQKTAIIFISAVHLTDLDRLKGYQRGAVDYISVPIAPELLRAKVTVFAELHRKTQQMEALNGELQELSCRLIAARDEERRRLARDLHDGLGQELAAAKLMVETLPVEPHQVQLEEKIAQTKQSIGRAIQQVRSISYLLHPPLLDERGLLAALRWYLDGLSERSGIETALELEPIAFPRLQQRAETTVFHIIQEALTNVLRHSGARRVSVAMVQRERDLRLSICDDGKGVGDAVAQLRPDSIGIGLSGMRERAAELGGKLRVLNADPGTVVEVTIPAAVLSAGEARGPA